MRLFRTDFTRFFALGFAAGALVIAGGLLHRPAAIASGLVTPAHAAQVVETPAD